MSLAVSTRKWFSDKRWLKYAFERWNLPLLVITATINCNSFQLLYEMQGHDQWFGSNMSRRWKISNPKYMFGILLLLKWNSFPKYWVSIWSPIQWNWLWLAKRSWLPTHWIEPSQGMFFRFIAGTKSECAGQPWVELWIIRHTHIISFKKSFKEHHSPLPGRLVSSERRA